MWWKLAGLGLIEIALVLLLFIPVKTTIVRYDTPEAARGHTVEIVGQGAFALGEFVIGIVAFGTPMWLAYLVVRKRKISK